MMFIKTHRQLSIALFALFVLCIPILWAAAQDNAVPQDSMIEFVGVVQAINGAQITVNGQVITLTGAEINTSLAVGVPVKVEGFISSNGQIVAGEINGVGDDDFQPGGIEIKGTVTSFDGTTLVIAGQAIDVTGGEIHPGVVPGAFVEVHLVVGDAGTWVVREVEVEDAAGAGNEDNNDFGNDDNEDFGNEDNLDDGNEDNEDDDNFDDGNEDNDDLDDDELKLVGTLEQVGDGAIVVSGQTIDATTARIRDRLVIGGLVEVELRIVNGILVAEEVENADSDDDLGGGNEDAGNDDIFGAGNEDFGNDDIFDDDNDDDFDDDFDDDNEDIGNSEPGGGDDDHEDDNSGPGNSDDNDDADDNSGPGNSEDDDDDNSGSGGGGDDNSGSGGGDDHDDDDDDHGGDDDDDDDHGGDDDDDDDDDDHDGDDDDD